MARLGVHDRLDDDGEAVVEVTDGAEGGGVLWVCGERDHFLEQGVVHGDADIVDCGCWVVVELLVHANCIWKFDGVEGCGDVSDHVDDCREEDLVTAENLSIG